MKRWGVLGGGGIAPSHLISLQQLPQVEVVGVADVDGEARKRVVSQFGVPGFASIESLLDEARPDAVTVALPAQLHLPALRLAAKRRIHVLCEKPLAASTAEAEDMIAAARTAGIQLGAILNNRGYAQTRWIKAAIDAGRLAPRVVSVRAAMARFRGEAAPMVFGLAIHYLDLMRWWLGEPSEVSGLAGDGYVLGAVRFTGGAGDLRLAGIGPTSAGVKVDVEFEEGRLTLGRYGIESCDQALGEPPPWDPEVEGMDFGAGHLTVIREAAEALEAGEPFPVSGQTGRDAVALCEAIVRAAETHRWEAVA